MKVLIQPTAVPFLHLSRSIFFLHESAGIAVEDWRLISQLDVIRFTFGDAQLTSIESEHIRNLSKISIKAVISPGGRFLLIDHLTFLSNSFPLKLSRGKGLTFPPEPRLLCRRSSLATAFLPPHQATCQT
jgi:hypothetical protein